MNRYCRVWLLVFIVALCQPALLKAQKLEDLLSKYTSENGKKYMQPFADAFAADFNSGLFHNAKIKKMGFQIYLGLESQVAFIPSKQKYFTATTESWWQPTETVDDAPTVFGPTDGKKIPGDNNGMEYVFPGGFDIDYLPLAMPQLTIGSVYGTDFTIRYFGTNAVKDLGRVQMLGWGVRHSIDQYLKMPVSLAFGYYHQAFKVGEYMDAKTNVMQLQSSFSVPIVTFYGGLGYEFGKVNMQYDYIVDKQPNETEEVKFEMTPGNTVRLTLGVGFNFGPFNLHGDYNIAKQNTLAFGLGFGIGEK